MASKPPKIRDLQNYSFYEKIKTKIWVKKINHEYFGDSDVTNVSSFLVPTKIQNVMNLHGAVIRTIKVNQIQQILAGFQVNSD